MRDAHRGEAGTGRQAIIVHASETWNDIKKKTKEQEKDEVKTLPLPINLTTQEANAGCTQENIL